MRNIGMANNKIVIDNDLLIEFTIMNYRKSRAPKSLGEALMDSDILNFLNKNDIIFETETDALKTGCILGLIKNCLELNIHDLDQKTISTAFGIMAKNYNIGNIRFDQWIKSETLEDFYENTLRMLKTIQIRKLKINALTIVNDVVMKQSEIDGEEYDKNPLDRFKLHQVMLKNKVVKN